MRKLIEFLLPFADIVLAPFIYPAGLMFKLIRKAGLDRLVLCRRLLLHIGIIPIRNHYYEPRIDYRNLKPIFFKDRNLAGVNWNVEDQLNLLKQFIFSNELKDIPLQKQKDKTFYFNNGAFESGDAEYWYQLIRSIKPKRIIEIGSGHSTLMAIKAINKNRENDPMYECDHVCIEPFEMPWLEKMSVSVIRKKVEDVELSYFSKLQNNDILFIDSSHIIKPEGDVLFEFLELLPSLSSGVIVHIHDIFSPKNYWKKCIQEKIYFWNEQYLLEAFLTNNNQWKILGALNFLHHNYFDKLKIVAPYLTFDRDPGSFYIQKTMVAP